MVAQAAPIPALVAGGPVSEDSLAVLEMVRDAMDAGAGGVCLGRQVFAHEHPERMARALVLVVHEGMSARDAFKASGM